MPMLQVALEPSTAVVAIDPGKVANRVWLSNGSGPLAEPVSMPVSRAGIAGVEQLVSGHLEHGLVIAIEARAVCIGRGRRNWNGGIRVRFGCSRPRRPRRPGPSSGRAGSKPMIVMVPR